MMVYIKNLITPGNISSGYIVKVINREFVYLLQAVDISPNQKAKSLVEVVTHTYKTPDSKPSTRIHKILIGLNFTAITPQTIPKIKSPMAESIEREVSVEIKLLLGLVK